jgi:hypothetical protein
MLLLLLLLAAVVVHGLRVGRIVGVLLLLVLRRGVAACRISERNRCIADMQFSWVVSTCEVHTMFACAHGWLQEGGVDAGDTTDAFTALAVSFIQ